MVFAAMRYLIVFFILISLILSAAFSISHVFAMDHAKEMGCGVNAGCVESTGSPLVDCVDHCLSKQVPSSPVIPVFVDWIVLALVLGTVASSFSNISLGDVFQSGRDAPFGRRLLLLQLRTVEIKS